MTDTGQVPGEGLPENAGMVEQPGVPAHGAYTYLSETTAEDEDLLLLPGAQGAWGNEVAPPAPEPVVETLQAPFTEPTQEPYVDAAQEPYADAAQESFGQPAQEPYGEFAQGPSAEAVHEPGPHETAGRDSGSVDLGGVRLPSSQPVPSAPTTPIPPITPRRPLHLGPPIPDASASPVRSLADRGPAGAPARHAGPPTTGPEYLDVPQPLREMAPQGAVPWGAPGVVAQAAETVVPATDHHVALQTPEPVGAAQAAVARLTGEAGVAAAVGQTGGADPEGVQSEAAYQEGAPTEGVPSEGVPSEGTYPAQAPVGGEGAPVADAVSETDGGEPPVVGEVPAEVPAEAAETGGAGLPDADAELTAAVVNGDEVGQVAEAPVVPESQAALPPEAVVPEAGQVTDAVAAEEAGRTAVAEVTDPATVTEPADPTVVTEAIAPAADPTVVPDGAAPAVPGPEATATEPDAAAPTVLAAVPAPEVTEATAAVAETDAPAEAPVDAPAATPEAPGAETMTVSEHPAPIPTPAPAPAPDAPEAVPTPQAPEAVPQPAATSPATAPATPATDAPTAPATDTPATSATDTPAAAVVGQIAQPEATAPAAEPVAPAEVTAVEPSPETAPGAEPLPHPADLAPGTPDQQTAAAEAEATPQPVAAPDPASQAAHAPEPEVPATDATQPGDDLQAVPVPAPLAPAAQIDVPQPPAAPHGLIAEPAGPQVLFMDQATPAQTPGGVATPHPGQPLGQFVQVEGSVPTTPHLAPTPPQPLILPAETPGDAEAHQDPPAVPAPREGDDPEHVELVQNADDLDTRAADQEESTATVEEVRQSTGPAAPAYDDAEREAVLKVMRERRDIRNGFRGDPIPHEVLLRVLEAAHTAPSVGHSQPWDFVVIRSADTRRSMHELAMRQRDAYAKSLPKGRAKQFKELKIEAILDTPVNIVVTADPTRGGRHTLGRHTQPQMAPYSAALAVENLWLAARAEGLGVGWVSFFDEREMVRALGLPEHLEVIAYLCVGYVDEFPDEPELMQAGWSKRRPLSWVVHEETYGRRALPGEEPHDLLAETVAQIRPLDAKALGEAWERQKRMTKPPGSLGMLEIISAQLSGLSRQCPPPIPEPAAVAIFAGDHGVHAQGVTPWPQEVTAQMVANFLGGGAVCNAFASQVGAEVCVVDVGVAADLPATPGLLPRKVRAGTSDMTTGPAMTREEAKQAIEVGIETARDLVAAGNKALLTGEMGIANTTASAALISIFTDTDPAEVTGRGTGINDETLARKTEVVRRALELHQPDPADPIGVLAAIGGFEHAAIVGLLLGGASLRTPVILDGVSAGAAALVARAIAPEVLAACIAGHRSAEPGHVAALNKLGLRPLVDLDLRLGEGTGALLALPLVQSTARAMHEVATFDSAGVTEK
ncbi:nicotinate-nucleotide--dimethylbenzimidazole phosphoribosyltransferase [Streptomyces sp. NPDC051913]|uniref:nicotinate-nucleotide--dimethylbenzimidazole phosphoribosyltransferase n=1 Tax=Streptomyces sp. NPDC051913 TaxID=3365676 RepID=UPI0037D1E648